MVLVITAILSCDFALSFRSAMELREVLIEMEEAEVVLKGMESQQISEEKRVKIKKFLEKLAGIRKGIQAELSTRYEVKISRKFI